MTDGPDRAAAYDEIPRCKHGFAVAHNESVWGLALCAPPQQQPTTCRVVWCCRPAELGGDCLVHMGAKGA